MTTCAEPSLKRQRTDTLQLPAAPAATESAQSASTTTSVLNESELRQALDTLSPKLIKSTLLGIALQQTDVAQIITTWYRESLEKRRNTVVDFDYLSKQVWRDLNVTHKRERESQKYESGLDVASDIEETIASIVKRATEAGVNFGTKKNALETLRKIGKSICLGPADSLTREVRNAFSSFGGTQYVEGMKAIVYSISEDDWPDWIESGGATEWVDKVQELLGEEHEDSEEESEDEDEDDDHELEEDGHQEEEKGSAR